jgi:hypothetical protein
VHLQKVVQARLLRIASVLLGAVPVAFGVARAVRTGSDLRYLWLAGAALVGSMVAMTLGRDSRAPARVSPARALAAVTAGAVSAAAIAFLMGTTAGPGIAIVAIAFGLCTGTSVVLATLARHTG